MKCSLYDFYNINCVSSTFMWPYIQCGYSCVDVVFVLYSYSFLIGEIEVVFGRNIFPSLHLHCCDTANTTGMNQLNLLKRTGYMMHQQLNIQQLYVLPTLYLCVLCLSENKQRLVPLTG